MDKKIINEIAQTIDTGEIVYVHRETGQILSYPDLDQAGDEYDYLMQEVMDIVDMDPDSYIRFKPLTSSESYKIMEGFVETVSNHTHAEKIRGALRERKPFRSFREMVESLRLLESWYDYKMAYLEMLVRDQF
jgi:predicted nucleic acid-binding OB-fold protein